MSPVMLSSVICCFFLTWFSILFSWSKIFQEKLVKSSRNVYWNKDKIWLHLIQISPFSLIELVSPLSQPINRQQVWLFVHIFCSYWVYINQIQTIKVTSIFKQFHFTGIPTKKLILYCHGWYRFDSIWHNKVYHATWEETWENTISYKTANTHPE